jgi:hypothetical protein
MWNESVSRAVVIKQDDQKRTKQEEKCTTTKKKEKETIQDTARAVRSLFACQMTPQIPPPRL